MQILAALVAGILAFWLLGAHNRLMRLRQAARSALSPLVSQLRQRHAVALALAEISRPLLGAENPMPDAVAAAAAAAGEVSDQVQGAPLHGRPMAAFGEAEDSLGQQLDLLALALQDLTSRDGPLPSVSELLRQRDGLQQQITVSREVYHRAAQAYNDALKVFPTTVAAVVLRFDGVPDVSVGPLRR